MLATNFKLCSVPRGYVDVYAVKDFVEGPWATLAMGDYPYVHAMLSVCACHAIRIELAGCACRVHTLHANAMPIPIGTRRAT